MGERKSNRMTKSVEQLVKSFELLPDEEKQQAALEIIRRSLSLDLPELSDDSFVLAAEQTFLQLDKEKSLQV